MANKITTIIDFVTDSAQRSVRTFRQSVADADGATNKFKAGASSAFATIQANAGALALGAGGALVAFGAKAVSSFTEGALAAGKFADASGLAVEDASRWAEVAGDLGVSTDAIAGGFVKLEKAIATGGPAIQDLGVQVLRTADGTADMNATMLDAIDRLGGIEDPAERAKAATELFGRGFADMAEIVLGDADDIKSRLDGVADAQVFDAEEVEKARKFRDMMDDITDSVQALSLAFGEVAIPAISGTFNALNGLFEGARNWGQTTRAIFTEFSLETENQRISREFDDAEEAAAEFDRTLLKGLTTFEDVRREVLRVTESQHAANLVAIEWAEAHEKAAESTDELDRVTKDYVETSFAAGAAAFAQAKHVDEVRQALFRQGEILADTTEKTEAQVEADERAAEQAEKHAAILESQRDVTEALADAEERRLDIVNRSLGGAIKAAQAQRDARDSLFQYNEQVKAHNEAAPEFKLNEDQMRDLVEETALEQLAGAEAAAQYRIDVAEAAGATVSASDEQRILREELVKLIDTLEGPVRDAVLQATADLDALAKDRFFTVHGNVVIDQPGRVGDFAAPEVGGQFAVAGSAVNGSRTINNNFYVQNLEPEKVVDSIRRYDRFNPT